MNETQITVIGRLVNDPELRFTQSGAAVANFTVASNARRFNKDTQQYEDLDPTFWPCSVWRDHAEHVAESLSKGDHVIVVGTAKRRTWDDKDGTTRERLELDVVEVGPALRWATARPQKVQRSSGGGGGGGGFGGGQKAADPWGSTPGSDDDTPPF